MSTTIPLAAILLLSLWLVLRASRRSHAQAATILAQLEAMDADWTRFELECAQTDRQLRNLEHSLNPSPPKPKPPKKKPDTPNQIQVATNQTPSSSNKTSTPEFQTSMPPASPRETPPPRAPQTIEEYEATRKQLPPPAYQPRARAANLFHQTFISTPPLPTSPNIRVNPRPSVVETPYPKRSLVTLCQTPLRLAARCLYIISIPVLYLREFAARFFTRPKPPPPAEAVTQNRAA
jgi:hypothetical protein